MSQRFKSMFIVLFLATLSSGLAKKENLLCITKDAVFHSPKNFIQLTTNDEHLWITSSLQNKDITKGCYPIKKSYEVTKDSGKSEFFRLVIEKNATVYRLEKRTII